MLSRQTCERVAQPFRRAAAALHDGIEWYNRVVLRQRSLAGDMPRSVFAAAVANPGSTAGILAAICIVANLVVWLTSCLAWLVGGWWVLSALGAVLAVVCVRGGAMLAAFPHLGDLPSGGLERELASAVQREVAKALDAISSWNLRLPAALEDGNISTLANLPSAWVSAVPSSHPDADSGQQQVDTALHHMGFVHSGRLPPVKGRTKASDASQHLPSNPLTFVSHGAEVGAAAAATDSTPDLADLPTQLAPLVPAIRAVVPVLAALRQQHLAGTLSAFGERLHVELASTVGTCRALLASLLLIGNNTGEAMSTPVVQVLPGGLPALQALAAWPGTSQDGERGGAQAQCDADTTLLNLHLQLGQSLLRAKEACPWLVSTPLAVPSAAFRCLGRVPGARWCGAAPPAPGTTIAHGAVVLADRPTLAALPSEGGSAAPFPSSADEGQEGGEQGGGSPDMGQTILRTLSQVLPLLRMALLVAVKGLYAPVAGFDFLRAEVTALAPGSKALWVNTQAITASAGLPAANPPSCSDVHEGPCAGGGCRALDAGLGRAFAWLFDWVPCVAWPATCLSCMACHCCCCRPLGRRGRRRLRVASGTPVAPVRHQHVLEGLKGPDGQVDGTTYISAVWLPAPDAVAKEGAVQQRTVALLCEPNMGMWCLHARFGEIVAELHAQGMHVLAWDYRGYGLSDGLASPARCRLDVTALKHALRSHPSLAPAVGKVMVHSTSIGGLAGVEAAMPLPPACPGDDGETALAVLDRNFASLPLTAERMVGWWAGPGMRLLLPRWGLDNAVVYLASPVPRLCLADPAGDSIIAWRAALAASVAATVAADVLPAALSRCEPHHQAALITWLQQRRQALNQHLARAALLPCAFANRDPLAKARRGPSTARLPRADSLAHPQEGDGASPAPIATSLLPSQRYHEGTCCNRRGLGGHASGASLPNPASTTPARGLGREDEEGEEEDAALLGGAARQPGPPPPVSDFLCVDALGVMGCELAWGWYGLLEWASFAVFHRTAAPPLLRFQLYTAPHVPIGAVEVPADGRAFAAPAAADEVPSGRGNLPTPKEGQMSSRLWTVPTPGTAVCNKPLSPRPWVPATYICGDMARSGCQLLRAFSNLDRVDSPTGAAYTATPPSGSAWVPSESGLPTPFLHRAVFEEEGRPNRVRQRLDAVWDAFQLQGLPLGAAGVVNALLHLGRIRAVKEADLFSMLQHGGLDGDTLDPATLGPWLAAGLVWDLGGKAVLPEHEQACTASLAEAVQAVALAQAVLGDPGHGLDPPHAQGARTALQRAADCLAALSMVAERMPDVHKLRLQRVSLPLYVADSHRTRQMMLPEGAFISLRVGHNGPHPAAIQHVLRSLASECSLSPQS